MKGLRVLIFMLLIILMPVTVNAYLDPSVAGPIFQYLLPILASFLVGAVFFMRHLLNLFKLVLSLPGKVIGFLFGKKTVYSKEQEEKNNTLSGEKKGLIP